MITAGVPAFGRRTSGMGAVAAQVDKLVEETPFRWRIDPVGAMRVPGIVFASKALLPEVAADQSLQQVVNVATLPGVVEASYAMPDIHWGSGFPIGGVAATDVEHGGVVSPEVSASTSPAGCACSSPISTPAIWPGGPAR